MEIELLYRSESTVEKLDGSFTRLMQTAMEFSWRDHMKNRSYFEIYKISLHSFEKNVIDSVDSWRRKAEIASQLRFWVPILPTANNLDIPSNIIHRSTRERHSSN